MHINPERSTRPDYDLLVRQVISVLEGERDLTANAAQFSALVYDTLADLNWAGFYLTVPSKKGEGQDLLVGPFQGKPACARIPFGRGVCGATAVSARPSWWRTCTPSRATSPAIRPQARKSCFRWSRMASWSACSTSTARS
jgi:hypothetical protein